jgi:hypothetical protein
MVPPLKRKALLSGMVIVMVIAGSASGKSLLAARPTGSRERAPRRRNWLRFTRLLSGVSSKPTAATDFPSQPRLSKVSIAPMPKDDVESFLARSVVISSDCLNHFLAATGILGPAADFARYHYHVDKAESKLYKQKQNYVWFRRRIPTVWRVFSLFVLSKGNAASLRAFPITTAKTIGPRVCDPTTFNP